jgi:hypothetical protein
VLGVAEHAELELGARDRGQGDRAVETLVLLGVILLEADLQLDGFGELAGLVLGALKDLLDAVAEGVGGELAVGEGRGGDVGQRGFAIRERVSRLVRARGRRRGVRVARASSGKKTLSRLRCAGK